MRKEQTMAKKNLDANVWRSLLQRAVVRADLEWRRCRNPRVKPSTGVSVTDAVKLVDAVVEEILSSVAREGRVLVPGLAIFRVKKMRAKRVVTFGQEFVVPARKRLRVTLSRVAVDAVDAKVRKAAR
jgi:nucleoid DNA-binding protein